ncbi:ATP-dependent DNA helicase RecG [Demequina sp. B12]|uniref:ATP-dependent DNA helicase RecG n=1 Tax=Demequina sp. B12 TaxID=2992757 RepID=UPI00237B98E9|nr:ATP-dependent DNA helicase RecG [Demequina sp. B12]MDE0572772.1 ATP-dependent DNA helicase RecG [Demequina sp. B12]
MTSDRLREPLKSVLGARTANGLAKLGVETVGDLVRHYPRRYGAPGEMTNIGQLHLGEHVTVMAQVRSAQVRSMRSRGGAMLEAIVTDGSETLQLTFFAKRAGVLRMHEDKLRAGRTGLFTGTVGEYRGRRQLTHPDYLIVGVDADSEDQAVLEASRPIPMYPASSAVPTWRIGRSVRTVLDPLTEDDVPDPLPAALLESRGLPSLREALQLVHVPDTTDDWKRGQDRLRCEEAFVLQTALARKRAAHQHLRSVPRPEVADGLRDALDSQLPFPLTDGQVTVGRDISADLASSKPMLRLLQGDVGAGKTVVALRAMLQVVDAGGQAALLAPTEVLAAQHARSLRNLMGSLADGGMLGGADGATRIALLTGSLGATAKRQALAEAASGAAGIVVGTHALLSETVQFADLGLVVVDEQHRFGVEQRDALRDRGEHPPHTLVMTATPIPRTVAMTVFGDLETSTLSERPAGRAEITTHLVPADNEAWLTRTWQRVKEEVAQGRRVYVVAPRIDDNDADGPIEGSVDSDQSESATPLDIDDALVAEDPKVPLASVAGTVDELTSRPELAGVSIGLMHGRLAPEDKDAAMARFASGATPVLVSTTVIEVGVDVPEATMMVVLDAERFGISQLHQLRGRVGRSSLPSLCLLVTRAQEGTVARERLDALAATTDGFELAERDLELRREGDVLGASQSGGKSSLRLLRAIKDATLIEDARRDAYALIEEDPLLEHHPVLARAVADWLDPQREAFLDRG